MNKTFVTGMAIVLVGLGSTATAQSQGKSDQPANNWGQEVKGCNSSGCYPGNESRGEYVRDQARDDQGPGYGREIHDLANPGKSDPKPRR